MCAQVCRSAGYFEHALAVAQAASEPEWCLEILLEDCRQFDEALDFLRGLARQQAAAALHRHGKARPSAWSHPHDSVCTCAAQTKGYQMLHICSLA